MEVFCDVDLLQVFQLEGLPILLPHVLALGETVEVEDQMHELFVVLIVIEGDYGDPVVKLITERVHGVVHYDKVFHIPIRDYAQILDVDALFGPDALISVQSILDKRPVRVKAVKDHVCIGLVARGKDHNLVVLVGFP